MVFWSPRLDDRVTRETYRVLDRYNRGVISRPQFVRRMRRADYTSGEAFVLLGEFQRGDIFERPVPPERIVEEVITVPPPRVLRSVKLSSRQDTDETHDLGKIHIAGDTYDLPATATVEEHEYGIRYEPDAGYLFVRWETRGNVSIAVDILTVAGDGDVTAIYRISTFQDCRLWTFTRYYRYIASRPKDTRDFELTVVLPFLAAWTEEDVRDVEDDIIALCDDIMINQLWGQRSDFGVARFGKAGYASELGEDVLEDILGAILEKDWARGWEPARDTEMLDVTKDQIVDWTVIDKTRHYWVGPQSGTSRWRIPG